MARGKGFLSLRGYYQRAKVFGYTMLAAAIAALVVYLFPNLFK